MFCPRHLRSALLWQISQVVPRWCLLYEYCSPPSPSSAGWRKRLVKFNKEKYKLPGKNNSRHQCTVGSTQLESNFAEKDLGVLVDTKKSVESWNHLGWKESLRSSDPTMKLTPSSPTLNHIPNCHMHTSLKHNWQRYHHFPWQPISISDHPFCE